LAQYRIDAPMELQKSSPTTIVRRATLFALLGG
jgi:hypothetical protein